MVKQTKLCYLKFTSINKCTLLLLGEKDKPEKHAEKGDKLKKCRRQHIF